MKPIFDPSAERLAACRETYQGVIQPQGFPSIPDGWASEWETFASSDGALQLFGILHHSEAWTGYRTLFVVHGLGEHGGRYLHFPAYLRKSFDSVYCLDLRGHGRSEGTRGHVDRFDLFTEDLVLAIRRVETQIRRRFGSAELHLLGHSMGGLIALRALAFQKSLPLKSVTVSAPLLGIRVELPWVKRAGARLLSRVWGSLHLENEVDPHKLSHDLEVIRAYQEDRLVHSKGTPRLYTELQGAISDTVRRDSGLDDALQFLIPLQDEIVDSTISQAFFRNLKLREKRLKTYPHFFHEPFNEIGKEAVFEDLCSWSLQHSVKEPYLS